jgi:hypothetical protein
MTYYSQSSVERLFTMSNIQITRKPKDELLASFVTKKPLPEPKFKS